VIFSSTTPKPSETWRNDLADRLLDQAPALCGNPGLAASHTLCEAAQGVAAVLREQETFPHELDAHTSCTLMSRALEAAGETSLARRLLLAGTSSVYASSWITAGQDSVWTLDIKKLTSSETPCMELTLFDHLHSMIDDYADVWDATSGRGIMGLKGLNDVTASILGSHATPLETRLLTDEVRDYCARHLDQKRQQRGWNSTPIIMSVEA
jgi:hypothetical protein